MPMGLVRGRGRPPARGRLQPVAAERTDVARQAHVRLRFWVEVTLAGASGILGVLTVFWRDWVEAVTGVSPDGHSGSLEWAVIGGLLAVSVAVGATAVGEWRRRGAARHRLPGLAPAPSQSE